MEWECPKHHDHLDGYVEDVRVVFFWSWLILLRPAPTSIAWPENSSIFHVYLDREKPMRSGLSPILGIVQHPQVFRIFNSVNCLTTAE